MKKVFVVRPYYDAIKNEVFELLQKAGAQVEEGWATDTHASDQAALEALAQKSPDLLLIPYHAGKDADGERVNGLTAIQVIYEARPDLRSTPILMPVSKFGKAGLELSKSKLFALVDESRVLILDEDEISSDHTLERLKSLLQ